MQEQVLFNAHTVGGAQSELGLFLVITAPCGEKKKKRNNLRKNVTKFTEYNEGDISLIDTI